ncbi:KN motif and ankyrin repeat domain-containing protein 1-like isoform X1 [Vespa mandarinia]|uniref:KN motif and ankyrin repeat domain-containing protein 1-like isoform X1 n=1 Tax=Vespa mandarinia TaxID=7446 RepID=UPI001618E4B4|nr:KN motif and ankyrin repeat domain-containing protein 1-like isoform X1 [Vespa mandarinia]XP_035728523.1 KN motif and ankyrin repeat domain-containing protein 1-like isoform X1 [Vespa mandarinia]XP_035728524.1 KN motif and ankyrin repeat domain-containing protein 1-like isoform X1 [Vespa mandarinia]XP_035728525.1 KN motif and ankyrin repeat domain-containing protein 1-like isoform X1 [Vespa mandarinia]
MALTIVPSARVFNGNVAGTQAYVSGSKCLCCPYGYHIDLDFVRYCEAVAAGSTGDRSSIERRKKRERRRQCQSMEVLLGLVSPGLAGIETESPEISRESSGLATLATTSTTRNNCDGSSTIPRSSHHQRHHQRMDDNRDESRTNTTTTATTTTSITATATTNTTTTLDLSDVVGDFEATLKRSSGRGSTRIREDRPEIDGTTKTTPVVQPTTRTNDLDDASIGSINSNLSTGALQNIREQMAASLERMRELEEQVKAIPMLEVQLSVLKEEKRNLLRRVEELSKKNSKEEKKREIKEVKEMKKVEKKEREKEREEDTTEGIVEEIIETQKRYRSQSFSEERNSWREPKRNNEYRNGYGWWYGAVNSTTPTTRDTGTMCAVMTRDVGVSHQQIRTRDVGMLTSTPIKPCLERSRIRIEEILPDFNDTSNSTRMTSTRLRSTEQMNNYLKRNITRNNQGTMIEDNDTSLEMKIDKQYNKILINPLQIETNSSYNSVDDDSKIYRKIREFGTNTDSPLKRLERARFLVEDIAPVIVNKIDKRSYGTITNITMKDVLTNEDVTVIVDDALRIYKNTVLKKTSNRGTQCIEEIKRIIDKKDQRVQTTNELSSSLIKFKSNIGIMAKPRSTDVGLEVRIYPDTRTIAVGPDPLTIRNISLNSINSRSHSFNYGDNINKRKIRTMKSIGIMADDIIKMANKSLDTDDLLPKKRDFGTSPIKKKFIDVSVGDSIKPHILISCGTNYCDNCKETIKLLAKQITNNNVENNMNHQNANLVSRIPRPSHIALNTSDHKKFRRQDTYTKIPATGIIRYDSDNKEQYDSSNRLRQLETEKERNDKSMSEDISQDQPEKGVENDEKQELPESALFQPIQDDPRKKVEPSKEMQAAMKVLNDSFKKSPSRNVTPQIKNATNIIQQEWFKISSTANANPLDVEDYLDCFEEYSSTLLEYIVNMIDSSGNTAMHYAVSHGNFDVVSILLDSKVCDINKANVAGYTAVMLAALAEVKNSTHASVANRLFQLADVNIRAKLHGQTALMLAVSHGRKDMTQLLLDAGAAINIQDEDGSTALMCAAEHGHTDIVRILLAHSECDSSIVDIDGSSALKIALEAGNRDIGVLLYAHEHVNRGTSPYSSIRRNRRGSKPTTPTGPSPSAPVSPAPSRRMHSSTVSLNTSKYSAK